jgi:hypothetical protein
MHGKTTIKNIEIVFYILEVLWLFAVAGSYYDKARKLAFGNPFSRRSCGAIC